MLITSTLFFFQNMMQPIQFGPWALCNRCKSPHNPELMKKGLCVPCDKEKKRLMSKELARSDSRTIRKASRTLLNKLNSLGDESAVMPFVMNEFLGHVGGKEGYAKLLAEDFQKARGVGLDEEEMERFDRRDGIIAKYHSLLTQIMGKNDTERHIDVSGLTDDDLSATLRDVCLEQVKADPVFRRSLLQTMLDADPELRTEIMEMDGKVVVPGYSKQEEEEPDLDESSYDDDEEDDE